MKWISLQIWFVKIIFSHFSKIPNLTKRWIQKTASSKGTEKQVSMGMLNSGRKWCWMRYQKEKKQRTTNRSVKSCCWFCPCLLCDSKDVTFVTVMINTKETSIDRFSFLKNLIILSFIFLDSGRQGSETRRAVWQKGKISTGLWFSVFPDLCLPNHYCCLNSSNKTAGYLGPVGPPKLNNSGGM